MKLTFTLRLTLLTIAVAIPATAWARIPGDWTDDALINGSPSIVDFFDLMIFNHFQFTSNPNGHLVGDENGSGVVDLFDFLSWNSNKFTDDDAGSCEATVCVTDAEYLAALTSDPRNIQDFSGSASAPIFTTTNSFGDLNVEIQPDTVLQAFTVVTANQANNFDDDFSFASYYNGRQQWEGGSLPWDPSDNGLVASFPTDSLVGSTVFWQLQNPTLSGGATAVGVSPVTVIPEPSSALILLMALGVASLRGIRRFVRS